MTQTKTSPEQLLEASYEQLGYSEGELFEATGSPQDIEKREDWLNKGEWLALAKSINAEKIFFVNNNPVIVFARHDSDNISTLRKLYNNIWCMARPRLLFLAKPGELAVYDLACKPSRTDEEWKKSKALAIAESAEQVASKLKKFHREQLESGRLFEDSEIRFGDIKNRADKALISDLKVVRQELINQGLSDDRLKYAHSLIGRSIFIRYLEDRDILVPEDFYDVAEGNPGWKKLLDEEPDYLGLDCSETTSLYPRVLANKDFTFALFRKLAEDFNGDMFPDIEQEEKAIKQTHLHLIRDLLYGDTGPQKNLFFYAYQFKVIPIELISSIYEEFYHTESESQSKTKKNQTKANPQGAYYTPPALVEFLLSKVLTHQNLETNPRILDPACGSGIFLVESFRRIVRYRAIKQGRRLRFDELRKILRDQLAGIDIEIEAIRVTSFSLYLALLHYLDPPSIREQIKMGNRLPYLVVEKDKSKPDNFNTLLAANAFDDKLIESSPSLKRSFLSCCADIVVGNPPWGAPSTKDKDAFAANKLALNWCVSKNKPTGKKERSQVFIWKALDALKPNGVSALLVHMNVFLMHHDNSKGFRETLFSEACLHSVYNFSHTRKVFFKGAIAPFAAILFSPKKTNQKGCQVEYWSSKNTKTVKKLQSVIFRRNDLKILRTEQDLTDHRTWKLYWWGNHHDENLIKFISRHPFLKVLSPDGFHGRGFEVSSGDYDSDWLRKYRELPTTEVSRYGTLDLRKLKDIPEKVKDRGIEIAYRGQRILVKRGIEQKCVPKGRIVATITNDDFAFRNSVYGIKLQSDAPWEYKCILGILWSSLASSCCGKQ
ncbi:class I SAM-dependent DNA methyltransferase [Planctomycetota bacterium]